MALLLPVSVDITHSKGAFTHSLLQTNLFSTNFVSSFNTDSKK